MLIGYHRLDPNDCTDQEESEKQIKVSVKQEDDSKEGIEEVNFGMNINSGDTIEAARQKLVNEFLSNFQGKGIKYKWNIDGVVQRVEQKIQFSKSGGKVGGMIIQHPHNEEEQLKLSKDIKYFKDLTDNDDEIVLLVKHRYIGA